MASNNHIKTVIRYAKKVATTFTPIGIISLYLGVPAVMISAVVKIVKKALWQRDNY